MARGINTINGVDYVYEYKSHWNAKLHRSEQKRDYIGKIKDGKFVPNKIYSMRLELEALKRQNGLPSESDEMPLEDEIELIYQKHEAHKAKLAEMKNNPKPVRKSRTRTEAKASKAVVEEKTVPAGEVEKEIPAVVSEPVVEEVLVAVEENPTVETEKKVETEAAVEEIPEVEAEPETEDVHVEPEVVEKAGKHVLREGELDDEEYGPDLFPVQPSVAPVEEEPEEEIVVEEEEEDEDPDLFAFSVDIENMVSEEETSEEPSVEDENGVSELPVEMASVVETEVEAEPVEAEPVEAEPVEAEPVEVPSEEETPVEEVKAEHGKKARSSKTRKEKKEEDNGQLFLF